MIGWYERLHPWNRIVLTSLVALLAIWGGQGALTIERVSKFTGDKHAPVSRKFGNPTTV